MNGKNKIFETDIELKIVNFEQAKALKELGFPKDGIIQYHQCPYCFYNGHCINTHNYFGEYDKDSNNEILYAPTLELVAKWLREEKKIYVIAVPLIPEYAYDDGNYKFHYVLVQQQKVPIRERGFESWEDALSAGIDKAIEILKSKKK